MVAISRDKPLFVDNPHDAHVWAYRQHELNELHAMVKAESDRRKNESTERVGRDDAEKLWASADELDEVLALPPATTLQELDARKQRINALEAHIKPRKSGTGPQANPTPKATPENIVKWQDYRDTHTIADTARHFGISEAYLKQKTSGKKKSMQSQKLSDVWGNKSGKKYSAL